MSKPISHFNLSCCTLVPKNDAWTVPEIAACQIAKNAALLIPDYSQYQSLPETPPTWKV